MTKFSGLMSLWIICFSWQYSNPATRQATKNSISIKKSDKNKNRLKLTSCGFVKLPVTTNMIPQISTIQEVHNKIKIFSILEGIVHIDQEWTVKLSENWSFVHYTFYASFCQYPSFAHFFHCIFHLEFFTIDLPNFTETTFSNTKTILETWFAYGYRKTHKFSI